MSAKDRCSAMRPIALYHVNPLLLGPLSEWGPELERVAALGFGGVCLPPPLSPGRSGHLLEVADHDRPHPLLDAGTDGTAAIAAIAGACRAAGLELWLDLEPLHVASDGALAAIHPDWFHDVEAQLPDPRGGAVRLGLARLDLSREGALGFWTSRLAEWVSAGVSGFRAIRPAEVLPAVWGRLIRASSGAGFIAWNTGMPWHEAAALRGAGFGWLASSLAWWNGRDAWFMAEREALGGPLIGFPEAPFESRAAVEEGDETARSRAAALSLRLAATLCDALLVPQGFEYGARRPSNPAQDRPGDWAWLRENAPYDLSAEVREATALAAALAPLSGAPLRSLSGSGAPVLAVVRSAEDPRMAGSATLVIANTDRHAAATLAPETVLPGIGGGPAPFLGADGQPLVPGVHLALPPGEVRVMQAGRASPVIRLPASRMPPEQGVALPRIGIEAVTPLVDGGRFPVKRTVGEVITVEADIVADTHATFGVALLWRTADEKGWREVRMRPLGNDRWTASFPLERMGRYVFAVEAWLDVFAGYRDELSKKHAAGVPVTLELEEGRRLVAKAAGRIGATKRPLNLLAKTLETASESERLALLLSPETAGLMALADDRPHRVRQNPPGSVEAERIAARFASWYEIFPRSQSGSEDRHGTLDDVIRQLPRVKAMGFDVLYFPPIHPIGRKNRKGRNNTLTPGPDDVGSPYAIGSEEGGHDALHPALGTIEDFHRLRDAAYAHNLELALDFAIQCAPDHPWLKEHPEWFDWRPDGTIKYAENPPKKYEDIVNVDFYAEGAKPSLWVALYQAVKFWVEQGVKIFRVDNPHTKPLPFWEWMIGEIRADHPDVLFLSEAFTRPKVMYRLAKAGFTQSYTYFTWRETKEEMAEYLTELSTTAPRDFFRPNFFVNTPDINPRHLQTGGRPMHLVRAALASTLSGLWGVYQGFELCEATPLPGKEEYLDSEKYQIRVWPDRRPGDIVDEVTRLNLVRRANPALQTHLGVTFLTAFNDNVLFYEKATPDRSNVILVAVSMDPSTVQDTGYELPLWRFGLPDHEGLEVEDLMRGNRFALYGKAQAMRLDPADLPFAIWRVRPFGA
ncbi:alpha-1,4-glucan--maltose-1-phosphate maltosyltransferase [Muricoccus aerilatus]|uniref:alpha-1,4-glucan--maltose-1-phosphate maltosyltransferase n=1 Tax=Muricoccus aerilatus TaxID=452982 RepID=UPI0009FDE9FC|nr:alpha-1,4-glucan--maltose-1-phosphate maltosyltransferase [Roseomonas aerilata]